MMTRAPRTWSMAQRSLVENPVEQRKAADDKRKMKHLSVRSNVNAYGPVCVSFRRVRMLSSQSFNH